MDKHIFSAASLRLNKPIPFFRIEPLHGASCHSRSPTVDVLRYADERTMLGVAYAKERRSGGRRICKVVGVLGCGVERRRKREAHLAFVVIRPESSLSTVY